MIDKAIVQVHILTFQSRDALRAPVSNDDNTNITLECS
jgi:hypothetical protein